MAGPFGYISLANALSWCLPAQGMRTKGPGAPGKEGSDEEDGLLGYVLKAGWKVPLEGKSKAWVLCSPTPTSSAFQELTHLPPPAPRSLPCSHSGVGGGGITQAACPCSPRTRVSQGRGQGWETRTLCSGSFRHPCSPSPAQNSLLEAGITSRCPM